MTQTLAFAGLISAAVVGSAALAQQHDPGPSTVNQPVHKPSPPPTCVPTTEPWAYNGTSRTPTCVPFAELDTHWSAGSASPRYSQP